MDTQLDYRLLVKRILQAYAQYKPINVELTPILSFDDDHGQYLLLHHGWDNHKFFNDILIHLQIRDDKIWIQTDNTEQGIAAELLAADVPKEHIVLGFKHPSIRPYTEFAVA